MTRPHGEERPLEEEGVPAEEQLDAADAAERLAEDPDDPDRNREDAGRIVVDDGPGSGTA